MPVAEPQQSDDPVEQEKQLKYASLVDNTIMLSNVTEEVDAATQAELEAILTPILRRKGVLVHVH